MTRNERRFLDALWAAERAALLTEWLDFLHDAQRFGSERPAAIADVLTFGVVTEVNR